MANNLLVGSGETYTTLEAALDWLVANHNYNTDGKATITITDAATYTLGNSDYPYDVNLSGTPTSSAYLEITSDATDPFSGPTLECTHTTGNGTLKLWDSYTYIHNLKFLVSSSTVSLEAIRAVIDNISNLLISKCVFINTGGGNDQDAIYSGSISTSGSIDNCVFVNFPRGALHLQMWQNTSDTQSWNVDHCSCAISQSSSESEGGFIGLRSRYAANTYNVAAYNNVAYHHTDDAGSVDCFNEYESASTVNWSGSNNIVDDTSAEAKFTSSYDSVTFTETEPSSGENAWLTEIDTATYANIDLEIAGQNSFTVTQNGTDRTGSEPDARQDFSTDILGNTRGATPCVGAFEFESGISGTGALTLPGLTLSGTAEREIIGSGTPSLPGTTLSGTGAVSGPITGTGALTLPAAVVEGVAERTITGAGTSTLPAATADGAGSVSGAITGSGALDISSVTANGIGEREITGSGAATLPTLTLTGTGIREITGAGALTLSLIDVSGVSVRELVSSGVLTFGAIETSGAAEREITGSGAFALPVVNVEGVAELGGVISGSGALTSPSITLTGVAERSIVGSGAATLVSITLSGQALRTWLASGSLSLSPVETAGTAVVPADISAIGVLTLPAIQLDGVVRYTKWEEAAAALGSWSEDSAASTLWVEASSVSTTWTED